jgi:hypothetical protein
MKTRIIIALIMMSFTVEIRAQKEEFQPHKNYLFLLANHHLEKRGTDSYSTSNPDFAIGYERMVFSINNNQFMVGLRTGFYNEYVLTGYGWEHPVKTRFFIGASPSYAYVFSKHFRLQVNLIVDVLIPDDYDETWWYFAIEPSFQYHFLDHFHIGISATNGVFIFFDPKAYFVKAGFRVGYSF